MRRALLAALVLLAACAGPKPCTRSLCVTRLDGTMELAGWNDVVRATSESPKPPVLSDATVTMVYGAAEFRHGKTRVTAAEGSSFKFTVSTRAVSSIEVSSGSVTVLLSTGAPVALVPGTPYDLPKAR
ncbi:MAG: hypothetical protein HYV14_06460 [Elusimicrobia bacterium]|nr:hypothetical protein [Elusimicrobiota bacterium]